MNQTDPEQLFSTADCLEFLDGFGLSPDEHSNDQFITCLNEIARSYLSGYYLESRAQAPSQIKRTFERLAGRARTLRRIWESSPRLKVSQLNDLDHLLGDLDAACQNLGLNNLPSSVKTALNKKTTSRATGQAILTDVIAYCDHMAIRSRGRVIRNQRYGVRRNQGNQAFARLIQNLSGFWLEYYKAVPGAVVDPSGTESSLGGPFVLFVRTYLNILRISLGQETLASEPALKHQLNPTDEALHHRIRRLNFGSLKRMSAS